MCLNSTRFFFLFPIPRKYALQYSTGHLYDTYFLDKEARNTNHLRIHITLMRIRILLFTSMRIRIQLLINWCESATTGHQTHHGSMSLHAYILSVNGPPWPHFWPVKLLNFDFPTYLDPDPAHKIVCGINANQNPQPCKKTKGKKRRCQNGFFCFSEFPGNKTFRARTNIP